MKALLLLLINALLVEYSFSIEPKYEFVAKEDTVTIYRVPYESMQLWCNTDNTVTIKVKVSPEGE